MLGDNVQEISIKNNDWEEASKIINILVENKYAVLVTLEEQLIIINYVYAADSNCDKANRNYVTFMTNDDFEDYICNLDEEKANL